MDGSSVALFVIVAVFILALALRAAVSENSSIKIYQCTTAHARFLPIYHSFTYPILFLGFDIDSLARGSWLIGCNRWAVASLWNHDYGLRGDSSGLSIREKLETALTDMARI